MPSIDAMIRDKIFLKSRFARRILTIFISCTILPLLALSVFAYRQITIDLRNQNLYRLKQTTKSISVSVYERLMFFEAEMLLIASQLTRDAPADIFQNILKENNFEFNQFKAMALYDADGHGTPLFGDTANFPQFAAMEKQILNSSKTLITTSAGKSHSSKTFMVAPVIQAGQATRYLIGEANIDNIGRVLSENVIPTMTDFLILDSSGQVLISSMAPEENMAATMDRLARDGVSGNFTYNLKNKVYLAGFNKLFLKPRYSIPEWTIILTQSDDDALRSVKEFKKIFPLIIIFSFLIVLSLSILFVRRSMLPLEKLKRGTQRIVAGDFNDKVDIISGDEFEDLAASFNQMAQKLSQQFNELRLTAGIGHFSAKIQDTEKLIRAIMDSIREFLPFDRAALLLLNETKSRVFYKAGHGYTGSQKQSLTTFVNALRVMNPENPIEQALVTQKPIFTGVDGGPSAGKPIGNTNASAANLAAISICAPIVYEDKSIGVLLLESTSRSGAPQTAAPDFWIGLGSQIAVSLSNAASFQKIQESEERFRKSFDHAAAGISLVATDGHILTANNYLLKMLGYEEKDIMAKTLEDISNPGHYMAEQSSLKRLLREEIEFDIYEKKFIHKKGHEIWGLVSISLLFHTNNTPRYYIMHIQNLSELKAAEKAQKELETRLRKAQR